MTAAGGFLEDLFSLTGRIALVTGGSSGIGVGMAAALAQAGAQVVLVARDAERLGSAVAGLRARGGQASAVSADLADRAEVERAVDEADGAANALELLERGRVGLPPVRIQVARPPRAPRFRIAALRRFSGCRE